MAKLSIKTSEGLNRVVVIGDFCDWDFGKAIIAERVKGQKFINIENMPVGEYRVFSCANFLSGEVYPKDGRQMQNRYFCGEFNETIKVFF